MATMKAVVFKGQGRIAVEEVLKPTPGVGEATTSRKRSICSAINVMASSRWRCTRIYRLQRSSANRLVPALGSMNSAEVPVRRVSGA
jgi:hypothetical protein